MTVHQFITGKSRAGWHVSHDPDAKAAAFNQGYNNIFDKVFAPNPYRPETFEYRWFEIGEEMAEEHARGCG